MEEFLKQYYTLTTYSVEFLAAVTGLFCLKKYKGTAAKYVIYFLIYCFLVDFLGNYPNMLRKLNLFHIVKDTLIWENYWWFTLFWKTGAILFYSFYFEKILKTPKYILMLKIARNAFLYFSIIYIIFNWKYFFNYTFPLLTTIGSCLTFMCVVFYFIEILNSERILMFYKSINFYFAATIFIWWLVITPLEYYNVYYYFNTDDLSFVYFKWSVYLFANIFMYLTFTFALLWCNPKID